MSERLPRLRLDLNFMPSPVPQRPGLLVRDPMGYSDATLIIPPPLVPCLACFDGQQTSLDLRAVLVQVTGSLDVSHVQQHLTETLSQAGFLHDEQHAGQREQRRRAFADGIVRGPAHAGTAYPVTSEELNRVCCEYMGGADRGDEKPGELLGIAAPHVSPTGGWQSYQSAYRALRGGLGEEGRERTFLVLGTSHYGEPDRFGLTRKGFATPFGVTRAATGLIDEVASRAPRATVMEDYCHAVEHSIEFQVVFLQHLFGPNIRVLPVLCGPFGRSNYERGRPEDNDGVREFFDVLGEIGEREGERLIWVLGVDMAHMGRRYHDEDAAHAGHGLMIEVARRDQQRMERISAGDADGYWERTQENQDDLKWCGSSPFYTFLKTNPQARGRTLRYEQWNIDEESVVSFAGMAFRRT